MRVIPAIDLMGGRVVRLVEGRRDSAVVYRDDPLEVVREFVRAGARRVHVVDLDGAFAGAPAQTELIERMGREVEIQTGGGIRDAGTVERLVAAGVAQVVLGTAAVRDEGLLRDVCERWPGRVIVAVDARDGRVALDGWVNVSDRAADEVARRAEALGAAALLYTDIARDGRARGPNVAATVALQGRVGIPVIASGGIGALEHLHALRDAGVRACVVGRALYAGAFTVAEALASG